MKTVLASISTLALLTVSASACEFMKTAGYKTMSVASIESTEVPMSTAHDAIAEETLVDETVTGAIENDETEKAE